MRKILFYIDSLRAGGAQRVMSNLVRYFAETGYDVILVNDYIDSEPDLIRYDVPTSVKRLALRHELAGNKYIKNVERILNLRRIAKAEKPDVMLSFLGKPNKRLLLATVGLQSKKIVSVRNDPLKEYGKSIFNKIIANTLFSFADGVVFQTEDAMKYFNKSIREKSTIILNPVSQSFFDTEWIGQSKTIITCGRLEKQKNHRLLINAFAQIAEQYSDYDLIIYGEGPLRAELEDLCSELGLQNRVYLPGNTDKIPMLIQQSSVFVLSSDFEGMPNALMEALAEGAPCISTDCPCGGPKVLIQDGINGLLTDCGNDSMLAEKIRFLLGNTEQAKKLGDAARELSNEFLPEIIYRKWEDYLFN